MKKRTLLAHLSREAHATPFRKIISPALGPSSFILPVEGRTTHGSPATRQGHCPMRETAGRDEIRWRPARNLEKIMSGFVGSCG